MKIRPLRAVLICLLSLSFIVPARAWPPPCPDCYYWNGSSCVPYGNCWGGCPECESCVNCYCDCTSECCDDSDCTGCESCVDCACVDDDDNCTGCEDCVSGSCEDNDLNCSSIDCETCNEGVCEDECPALGEYCWYGDCVECIDVLDCELCYVCIHHECVHPCDECYYPKYCGSACACVECYPGTDDTTTCSSGLSSDDCTGCTEWPISPCSGREKVVYTNNTLTTCTGPDCGSVDVLCYTTYECEAEGWIPFLWCKYNVPGPNTCSFDIEHPVGPGCWSCVIDEESADPTYEPQGDCPVEAWP